MTLAENLEQICGSAFDYGKNNPTAMTIEKIMRPLSQNIRYDNLGNLICTVKSGKKKKAVLCAHMDKIAAVVTSVDKRTGMIRFAKAGGIDIRILPAARVKVLGKETLRGCICSTPPHLSKGDKKEAASVDVLAVDCGKTYEEISAIVKPGDRIEYDEPFIKLSDCRYCSPYLDNSAGCAAIIETAFMLENEDIPYDLDLIFTTREEVGSQGAAVAAFESNADIALITDVSFGGAPGVDRDKASAVGSGAMICISPILQKNVSEKLIDTAENNGIPYTTEVCGRKTSTDADCFVNAGAGIKTGLASIPLLSMHTPAEIADIRDIQSVASLFAGFLKEDN